MRIRPAVLTDAPVVSVLYAAHVLTGTASFVDANTVQVETRGGRGTEKVTAKNFVIGVGSSPARPSNIPFDEQNILTSDEVLRLKCLPRSMIVVGGGAVGAEYASIFAALAALAAWTPYRIFGVVPFTTGERLVEPGPPPAVDPYADVGAAPQLADAAQKDFMWCRFCHSFEQGGPHLVGPNLHRVFGRRAGSAAGFYYSDAIVQAGRGGFTWDDARVAQLIGDPAQFLGGRHRMRYKPITDPDERAQIVAALKAATK